MQVVTTAGSAAAAAVTDQTTASHESVAARYNPSAATMATA